MHDDFHVSVPLKLSAVAYFDHAGGPRCTVRIDANLSDLRCSDGSFPFPLSTAVTINLISTEVARYYADIAGNMMRPLQRFPALEQHFADYRLACWFNPQSRHEGLVIIAQLPEDVAFRLVLMNALLHGYPAAIGFIARFGNEIGAPLPTPREFQAGMQPIFYEAPTFYVHPAAG